MNSNLEQEELFSLNQIIAELYGEENKEKALNIFLENLKKLVFFEKGDIYFYKQEKDNIIFEDFIYVDWNEHDLDSYLHTYGSMDDVLPIVSNKQPIMFRSSDIFITNERQKTQYYCELIQPAGMQHSIEGNIYVSDDGYIGGIGIHRSDACNDFSQKDLEILKLVRPHLSNIAKTFFEAKGEKYSYLSTMPFLSNLKDLGVCIWDFNLKLLESNLENNAFVPPKHKEELIRSVISLCKSLREIIKRKGRMFDIDENRAKSKISIGDKSYFADVTFSPIGNQGKGKFIAIIYDYAGIFENIMLDLQSKYMLTDREFEVLQYTISGMNSQEIADKLFISIPTVKKHLTNVYRKMGIVGKGQIFSVIL